MSATRNVMRLEFSSRSENESFARVAVAAFVAQLDPTVEELTEIKTAVSEAVTNAIIHGYGDQEGMVSITCTLEGDTVEIMIDDQGVGIEDIELARQPMYTSRPDLERSGMGFTIMENFVDKVEITSRPRQGTRVRLVKRLKSRTTSEH
ncbi:anti-sigma F factor [Kyrpidia spormannii]|uniref:Anti-sigma F factor n=2 Tax=Kyrpidia spormannii TaxID=2055160 RepID=A0A2K8N5Z0_9BACL|nr:MULTISPECIES: anti-sigma F factor [Kyrpidia]HHY68187.1 anti-sigma F factor [Alicyclobacillus sp.]ATY84746.1 anti-sigma F factor [Kyrpidia spormannii]MCL6575501.1 anti-sigma F factor [Kyrpidia sp.]CAB3391840.1 anti-sigma factor (antagonist of sigma(F)) and serine kinase [Kyrpidia spormannii]CAB3392757.1 anti-sigma factor (antagonist of sigma(F)) and serine kinase [Kyrpidia spormannii]